MNLLVSVRLWSELRAIIQGWMNQHKRGDEMHMASYHFLIGKRDHVPSCCFPWRTTGQTGVAEELEIVVIMYRRHATWIWTYIPFVCVREVERENIIILKQEYQVSTLEPTSRPEAKLEVRRQSTSAYLS